MDKINSKILINSLFISFIYVGLGTVSVLSAYPSSPLYGGWVLPVMLLTLPVNVFSFGIMFSDYTAFGSVLIVQSIVFLIFWFLLFRWMTARAAKKS